MALIVSLLGTERVHLGLQPLAGAGELLLLALQLGVLSLQVAELLLYAGPPGQRLAGQVLAADLEGLLRLIGQLVGLGVQLVGLQLDPLTAGRHIGDAAADLLQQLELALVGVVEGLARILELVQGLVGLGTEDQRDPLKNAAHEVSAGPSRLRFRGRGRSQASTVSLRGNRTQQGAG